MASVLFYFLVNSTRNNIKQWFIKNENSKFIDFIVKYVNIYKCISISRYVAELLRKEKLSAAYKQRTEIKSHK